MLASYKANSVETLASNVRASSPSSPSASSSGVRNKAAPLLTRTAPSSTINLEAVTRRGYGVDGRMSGAIRIFLCTQVRSMCAG